MSIRKPSQTKVLLSTRDTKYFLFNMFIAFFERIEMEANDILMIVGDFVEDHNIRVLRRPIKAPKTPPQTTNQPRC